MGFIMEAAMESHEAFQIAINRRTRAFAKRLNLSYSAVAKWQEPYGDPNDSGSLNPLDRVERVIETALVMGESPDNAYAPLYYLDQRFNRVCVDTIKLAQSCGTIQSELLKSVEEFGELASSAGAALQDNKLTRKEAKLILGEGSELIRQVATFLQMIREKAK